MQVCLGHLGEVEVDDDVDCLDVDTAGEEVAAHEVAAQAGTEVVEHSVTVSLASNRSYKENNRNNLEHTCAILA